MCTKAERRRVFLWLTEEEGGEEEEEKERNRENKRKVSISR